MVWNKTEQIPFDAATNAFASMRMRIAWPANTYPDIVFKISQIVQVTRLIYEKDIIKHCKRLNIKIVSEHDTMIS